jgi:ABC-type amino acid transport substrate-binding protein
MIPLIRHKQGLILLHLCFLLFTGYRAEGKTANTLEPPTSLRIVHCEYRPFYFKGGNGDMRGILVDFWNLWSQKTEIPVTFSITSWEKSLQQIKDDRADINAGIFFNEDQDRFLDFSRSFFNIPTHLFHQPGIHPTLNTLQHFRIGSVRSDFSNHYLKTELGVTPTEFDSHEQLIAHTLNGRIDAFIMEEPVAESYLAKHNGLQRLIKSIEPVYTQSFRAGVKEGRNDLKARINTGLSHINKDEVRSILSNWKGSTATELTRLRPTHVVIATSVDQQPFHFVDNEGHVTGMLVDLWRLWGRENGIEITFKSGTWSESLAMVREGKADIHAGCFYSKDREVFMDFAIPLSPSDTHFFFHKSVFGLKDLEDLTGFKIGVLKNDFAAEFIRQHLPGASIASYSSNQALFDAVQSGNIRVFVGDTPTALFFLKKRGLQSQFRHHPARPLYSNTYFGAVAKGKPALVKAVKDGFSAISPQKKAAVERRWTGKTHQNPKDVLVISCEKDFPPYSMLTPQGDPTGIVIDFWRLWSKKTGRTVEFRVLDRSEILQALITEQVDIHSAMVAPGKLDPQLTLSQPFYQIHSRLFFRADRTIDHLDDTAGQPIAAVRDSPTATWFIRNRPDSPLRLFDTEEEIVLAAAQGEIDIFAGPFTVM